MARSKMGCGSGGLRRFAGPAWCLWLLGIAVTLADTRAFALPPNKKISQFRSRWFDTRQGLPISGAEAVAQTPDGYLWVATQAGLARFDGFQIETFDESNSTLPSSFVTSLEVSADGALWIGTFRGGVVQLKDRQFVPLTHPRELVGASVASLYVDPSDQSLWVGTLASGLFHLNGREVRHYGDSDGLPGNEIRSLLRDQRGRLWVGTLSGLAVLDGERFHPFRPDLVRGRVRAMCQDKQGALYFTVFGRGLLQVRGDEVKLLGAASGLPNLGLVATAIDRDGGVWVGVNGALCRLVDQSFDCWKLDGSGRARSIREDADGNLWAAFESHGVLELSDAVAVPFGTPEGLPDDNVEVVLEDRLGARWVGTGGGGLARLDGQGVRVFTKSNGLPAEEVSALFEDRDGSLLVGTSAGIVRYWAGAFHPLVQSRVLGTVTCIERDSTGKLWVGTTEAAYREEGHGKLRQLTAKDGLAANGISGLFNDRSGGLLLLHNAGVLTRYRDGAMTRIGPEENFKLALAHVALEDESNNLWVGGVGGVQVAVGDRFGGRLTSSNGLGTDHVCSLLEGPDGNIWVSSINKGLLAFPARQFADFAAGRITSVHPVVALDENDGLRSRECNAGTQPGAIVTKRGTLLFTTAKGLVEIDTGRVRAHVRTGTPQVVQLLASGHDVPLHEGPPTLRAGTREVQLRFTAPNLTTPHRTRFRYRLEGYDLAWQGAGARREAFYTGLSPGAYRFAVSASADGVAAEGPEASLSFTIAPFFYQTLWFRLATAFAGIALVTGGFRMRVHALRRRQKELEALVSERTKQLALANEELNRLSFTDGLTNVANRRQFDAALASEWRRASRNRTLLSLLLIDIDFFKKFNDRYGHLSGDECLRSVAAALKGCVHRAGDVVARYGGEEFAVLLPETDSAGARKVAERACATVRALAIPHEEGATPARQVTISIGALTARTATFDSPAAFFSEVDRTLYRAKAEGRDRHVCSNDAPKETGR